MVFRRASSQHPLREETIQHPLRKQHILILNLKWFWAIMSFAIWGLWDGLVWDGSAHVSKSPRFHLWGTSLPRAYQISPLMPNLRAKSTLWHAFPCKIDCLTQYLPKLWLSFSWRHGRCFFFLLRSSPDQSRWCRDPSQSSLTSDAAALCRWLLTKRRSRESSCHPRRQDLHVEQDMFSRASPQPKHMWSKSLKVHCFPASVPVRPLYTPSGHFCLFPSLSLARVIFFCNGYFDGTSWQVWPFPRLIL